MLHPREALKQGDFTLEFFAHASIQLHYLQIRGSLAPRLILDGGFCMSLPRGGSGN